MESNGIRPLRLAGRALGLGQQDIAALAAMEQPGEVARKLAWQASTSDPAAALNIHHRIEGTLLPGQAAEAVAAYRRTIAQKAQLIASQNPWMPPEIATQAAIRSTPVDPFLGNAPQGADYRSQLSQAQANPEYRRLARVLQGDELGYTDEETLTEFLRSQMPPDRSAGDADDDFIPF